MVIVVFWMMVCCANLWAQEGQPRGLELRGQVLDQAGAVVVGAAVRLDDAPGHEHTARTDPQGLFRFHSLEGET